MHSLRMDFKHYFLFKSKSQILLALQYCFSSHYIICVEENRVIKPTKSYKIRWRKKGLWKSKRGGEFDQSTLCAYMEKVSLCTVNLCY
jgi:hypothetical protein